MAIANYWHCCPGGNGLKNGTNWANAFDEPALEVFQEGAVVAGDIIFIETGNYVLDSAYDFSARDGTATSPIAIIGVTTAPRLAGRNGAAILYSDWARLSADRPFFDCVTFQFKTGDYTILRNIYFQGSITNTVLMGNYCVVENCKFDNDWSAVVVRSAINIATGSIFYNNEILSANCYGLASAANCRVKYNYFHDIPNGYGYIPTSGGCIIEFNIFDNILVGFQGIARVVGTIENNTFYNCGQATIETTGYGYTIINNIVEGSTTDGFLWTTQTDSNFFWNNHGNDARCNDMWDGVDVTTVFKDYPNVTLNGDPKFKTPGSDFELDTGSPCLDTGMSITLGV